MKTAERDMARKLRREQGLSVPELARRVGVSKSSVSNWVRDIDLTPDQRAKLVYRKPVFAAWHRRRRVDWQKEGRTMARRADPVHAAACMLFWAEGAKSRNAVKISNSDPDLLRLFVAFLRRYFDVPDEKFRVWCNLFADHLERLVEVEQFWLDTFGLPRTCLNKSTVNVYSRYSKKMRTNKLPYGTCRVTVCDTHIAQHLFGAIQEYGGFDRPEWLD